MGNILRIVVVGPGIEDVAMNRFSRLALPIFWVAFLLGAVFLNATVSAHPGSGIVVDRQGQVFFADTGVNNQLGLWKIDARGRLMRHQGPHYHFMSIDHQAAIGAVRLPSGVETVGKNPMLVLSGGFPVTIGSDGALYYPQPNPQEHVEIMRLARGKSATLFATLPDASEVAPDGKKIVAQWIHGFAAGPDRCLYYTEQRSVRKISPDGVVSVFAGDIQVADCVRPAGSNDDRLGPALRGLDVKSDGTVFVAASACSAVLSISPKAEIKIVLRASDSWSPTGVAVFGDNVYVLEYLHTDTHRREDWLPRVRRISPDGSATTLATITQELRRTTDSNGN